MRLRGERGFTIIELLVVSIVIAILAAIAISVFLRQRERGYVAQSQSALRNARTAAETWGTQNKGNYDGVQNPGVLQDQGASAAASVALIPTFVEPNGYCIVAIHFDLDEDHEWKEAITTHQTATQTPGGECP